MPAPQTITHAISQDLATIHHRGFFIDQQSEEYVRLDRELRKLIKTDAASAYWMLGALCSYVGDLQGMHSNYKNASRLSADPMVRSNYAITLNNVGFFSEAAQDFSFLERPENGQIGKAILLNIECGRFRTAVILIKKWNELHKDDPLSFGNLVRAVELMNNAKVNDNAFLPCLDIIGELLREHRLIFLDEPVIDVVGDDDSAGIVYRMLLRASARTVVELEAMLVQRLFASNADIHDSLIQFGFLSAGEFAKQAA